MVPIQFLGFHKYSHRCQPKSHKETELCIFVLNLVPFFGYMH